METLGIDDVVQDNQQIIQKRKHTLLYIFILCLGLFSLIAAYNPAVKDIMNLSTGLWVVGFLCLVIGAVGLLFPSKYFYYLPTKERVSRQVFYFSLKDKNKVIDCITNGHLERLKELASKVSTGIMVVIYTTPSHQCEMAQIQEYVPFKYVPLQPVQVFSKEEAQTES